MTDIRVRFGLALRECRNRQRLTQEQLAERCGLSQKFIGEIERGVANPTIATVDRIANSLAVEVSALFGTQEPPRDDHYRISKRDLQSVREAAASLDAVMQQFPTNPAVHYRQPRRKR